MCTTGPRGFIRSLQAANAVATLVQEQVLQGQLDPPQTVLRKLFEKLGATYIKLGQVCGSLATGWVAWLGRGRQEQVLAVKRVSCAMARGDMCISAAGGNAHCPPSEIMLRCLVRPPGKWYEDGLTQVPPCPSADALQFIASSPSLFPEGEQQ